MVRLNDISGLMVALLVAGSAILLVSCSQPGSEAETDEDMITLRSNSLRIISSNNGEREYKFFTPLMEEHGIAREPYREFRRGIVIEGYNEPEQGSESMAGGHTDLAADYAIFFENQELWEIKGNVVGHSADGNLFETQQLFWNMKTKRIYSNVDMKITQVNGDLILGTGFESDEAFENWEIHRPKGKVGVDPEAEDEQEAGSGEDAASPQASDTERNDPERALPDSGEQGWPPQSEPQPESQPSGPPPPQERYEGYRPPTMR